MGLNFKTSQKGYILLNKKIENYSYYEYLKEFGSDETTTPRGIAPRLYVDGNSIMTWGVRGNNHAFYASFKNKREATAALYEIWENYISEKNWDAPLFFAKKIDLFKDLADLHGREIKIVKRYFKMQDSRIERAKTAKIKYDNRPSFTNEMMLNFINSNRKMINESLKELEELKVEGKKDVWQVKANSLIQKVSNNDFRVLNWKEIYNLIKNA